MQGLFFLKGQTQVVSPPVPLGVSSNAPPIPRIYQVLPGSLGLRLLASSFKVLPPVQSGFLLAFFLNQSRKTASFLDRRSACFGLGVFPRE